MFDGLDKPGMDPPSNETKLAGILREKALPGIHLGVVLRIRHDEEGATLRVNNGRDFADHTLPCVERCPTDEAHDDVAHRSRCVEGAQDFLVEARELLDVVDIRRPGDHPVQAPTSVRVVVFRRPGEGQREGVGPSVRRPGLLVFDDLLALGFLRARRVVLGCLFDIYELLLITLCVSIALLGRIVAAAAHRLKARKRSLPHVWLYPLRHHRCWRHFACQRRAGGRDLCQTL
mmetsp:Transcript_13951/g.33277  ORF Transcript_13951/g.33277 Transcript_13951/m.33277 type:complete len:232 (-) Transcript_13951:464-1159(-)